MQLDSIGTIVCADNQQTIVHSFRRGVESDVEGVSGETVLAGRDGHIAAEGDAVGGDLKSRRCGDADRGEDASAVRHKLLHFGDAVRNKGTEVHLLLVYCDGRDEVLNLEIRDVENVLVRVGQTVDANLVVPVQVREVKKQGLVVQIRNLCGRNEQHRVFLADGGHFEPFGVVGTVATVVEGPVLVAVQMEHWGNQPVICV